MVEEIKTSDFYFKIANGTSFVKFWGDFCGPCKSYAVNFSSFAKNNPNVNCYSVNAIEELEITDKFKISRIPVTIIFKDGVEIRRLDGIQTPAQLESNILWKIYDGKKPYIYIRK